ncbi:MAG: transcription-repair coupling factor [Actinobacteria bacterium]|nr:transcription-repair coupling factor [Actinomycetota bacterium]
MRSQKKSLGNSAVFVKNLKDDLSIGRKIVICTQDIGRVKKIEEILLENSLSFRDSDSKRHFSTKTGDREGYKLDFSCLYPGVVNILTSRLYHGYQSDSFSLYGELDVYERMPGKAWGETGAPEEIYTKTFEAFKPGDYVVHKTHGIGRYIDIVTSNVNGHKREYFLIEYANNDKLYVPTWQIDRLHRYIGDERPTVSPLDSNKWESVKNRVRQSVRKLAIDLARLYAEREQATGFAFPEDSPWQKEIEDLFPFKETPDQVKAIEYVKRAMEKPIPMDVLVCGDVGFGKTEVAIRAAFKAIEAGKQVLMLVPTTILANQHYHTFSERYRSYPVIVEVISRFRTKKEQKRIVEDFSEGKIDMLIGTHRLLEDDIRPKDLGLLIIDEEQRFGVNSKEKLKLLKKEVDVLTLTATPIPRTLYMALTDIRDLVLMETSPEGRYPVETFVGERDDYIIKMAIEREISRGGQVYYVYNRIFDIGNVRNRLERLVPQARIALTHGKMESRKIEEIMEDFINRKYDVLLTTSIIESGMDIGNVNTLIVENSHRFGLSQLYQLRGRVGRSFERAYAYFFYPTRAHLNFEAFQRLKTLKDYTELGSGYSVALKDLEIRGAGELLGPRQHGHINSVGFDMYCQIIKEEIEKQKGNMVEEDINVQIELPVSAYIPKNYIRNERERLGLYKKLAEVGSLDEVDKIVEDIEERYGKPPLVVENLANIARIKFLMRRAKIEKIVFIKGRGIILKKISLSEGTYLKMSAKNKSLIYKPREKELVMRNFDKNVDLSLVLADLSDIISLI